MAERNCYSGSTCEELVTIGYMKEMVANAGASGCVTVNTPSSGYSSCCSADVNGYIPTYGQIENGIYANKRVIASDPSNDVNGFSAKTPTLDTLGCCGNGVTINDKKVKKDDFTLGVTDIESINAEITDINKCTLVATYKEVATYKRWIYSCGLPSATTVEVNRGSKTIDISDKTNKVYGQITQTASTVGDVTTVSGISNVTFSPETGSVTVHSIEMCRSSVGGTAQWSLQGVNYNAYVEFSFPAEFACEGSSYINVTTHSECGNDSFYISSATINGMTIPYENSRFEISNPSINDGNTFEVNIAIGGGTPQRISFQITKPNCKQTVTIKSAMDCGLYPGEDDWSNTKAVIHPFR